MVTLDSIENAENKLKNIDVDNWLLKGNNHKNGKHAQQLVSDDFARLICSPQCRFSVFESEIRLKSMVKFCDEKKKDNENKKKTH